MTDLIKYCLNCMKKTGHNIGKVNLFCYCNICGIITHNPNSEPELIQEVIIHKK